MLKFIIGTLIGATIGFFVAALFSINKEDKK